MRHDRASPHDLIQSFLVLDGKSKKSWKTIAPLQVSPRVLCGMRCLGRLCLLWLIKKTGGRDDGKNYEYACLSAVYSLK